MSAPTKYINGPLSQLINDAVDRQTLENRVKESSQEKGITSAHMVLDGLKEAEKLLNEISALPFERAKTLVLPEEPTKPKSKSSWFQFFKPAEASPKPGIELGAHRKGPTPGKRGD